MKSTPVLVLIGIIVLAALALIAGAPLYTFQALQQAAERGDRAGIEARVDFPALRANLKTQLSDRMLGALSKDKGLSQSPFGALGALLAPTVVDQVVDATVTPEGIAAIALSGRAPLADLTTGKTALPPPAETAPPPVDAAPKPRKVKVKTKFAYEGVNAFKATYSDGTHAPLVWVMERRGFGWKLTRIDLPPV